MDTGPTDDTTWETARKLLAGTQTCTLATASTCGVPEAATIRFVADDQLDIYITTESMYQKHENMTDNPAVAIVADGDTANLQLQGYAEEADEETVEQIKTMYRSKYGPTEYLTNKQSVYFVIQTDWARMLVDGSFPPTYKMVIGDGQTAPLG